MKIVVLGASGNVGTALLRALEAEPAIDEVVAVARRPPDRWDSAKTTWRAVDIVADPLEPVLAGADAVVHLAWLIQPSRDRAQTHAVNVGGSRRARTLSLRRTDQCPTSPASAMVRNSKPSSASESSPR